MSPAKPKSFSAVATSLKLVVVGQGETRGRRPHLLRLRESLITELKTVADGQLYLLVEVALRRMVDELKARPPGIEVIQSLQLEPSPEDEQLLEQRAARSKREKAKKEKESKSAD